MASEETCYVALIKVNMHQKSQVCIEEWFYDEGALMRSQMKTIKTEKNTPNSYGNVAIILSITAAIVLNDCPNILSNLEFWKIQQICVQGVTYLVSETFRFSKRWSYRKLDFSSVKTSENQKTEWGQLLIYLGQAHR